ncbi:MAG: hypothetical protein JXX28_00775 [Deltaproteobacteria bacterium]|nr:hypothetical protein [Deltaproteobacteria bacterium]
MRKAKGLAQAPLHEVDNPMTDQSPHERFARAWPGVAQDPEALVRLRLAFGSLPETVQRYLARWAESEPERARVAFWGFSLAGTAGFRPLVPMKGGFFRMLGPEGAQCLLGAVALSFPEHEGGAPAERARLEETLDQAMGDRAYVLHIRRPLPDGVDAEPVGRAVRLWLQAIDRGEWYGQNAIYEGEGVDLEITLTGSRVGEGRRARVFTQGPVVGLDRLRQLYEGISAVSEECAGLDERLPTVLVIGAEPRWTLTQGHVLQTLYGLPAQVDSGPDGTSSYYTGEGHAFFADPENQHIGGLWWVQGRAPGALEPHAWSHLNPWSVTPESVPRFPGWAFTPRGVGTTREGLTSIEMSWSGGDRAWSLRP